MRAPRHENRGDTSGELDAIVSDRKSEAFPAARMSDERHNSDTRAATITVRDETRGPTSDPVSVGRRSDALRRFLENDGHDILRGDTLTCLAPGHMDVNPSAHLYDGPEGGHVHCFACGYHVDAFTYLVKHRSLSKRQAMEMLEPTGPRAPRPSRERPKPRQHVAECPSTPLPAHVVEAHQRRAERLLRVPAALDGRGFTLNDLHLLGVAAEGDRAIIPITGPEGQVLRLKLRSDPSERGARYRYVDVQGIGTPAWCSPAWGEADTVLVMEGELNASAAWCARPDLDLVGVAGTSGSLPLTRLSGRAVVLYADDDPVGVLARDRWARALHARGCTVSMLQAWPDGDACDIAHRFGRDELRQRLS